MRRYKSGGDFIAHAAAADGAQAFLLFRVPRHQIRAADAVLQRSFNAEPWDGSYRPKLVSFKDALGSMPIEPVIMLASSERISPNIFSVRITSNWAGLLTSCMAQLSTSISSTVTSGYSFESACTTCLQSLDVSRTFALSTLVTFFLLTRAISKAFLATLSISFSL